MAQNQHFFRKIFFLHICFELKTTLVHSGSCFGKLGLRLIFYNTIQKLPVDHISMYKMCRFFKLKKLHILYMEIRSISPSCGALSLLPRAKGYLKLTREPSRTLPDQSSPVSLQKTPKNAVNSMDLKV